MFALPLHLSIKMHVYLQRHMIKANKNPLALFKSYRINDHTWQASVLLLLLMFFNIVNKNIIYV